jgi:hypothetical protein
MMQGTTSPAPGLATPTVAMGAHDLIRYKGPPPIPSVGAQTPPAPPQLSLYTGPAGAGFPGPAPLHGAALPPPVRGGW